MITGIETAGLVLAVFPLVISALEHYQEGFATLQDWWSFRKEFMSFVHSIGIQNVLFIENIEELLRPFILSDAEMGSLLQDPGGSLWSDPELEKRLKERLPNSYGLYLSTIDEINVVMEKLMEKLGIKDGQANWDFDHTSVSGRLKWAYEFRRIKFTLSKTKRDKLLKVLTKHNKGLQKLLDSSDKLAPSRQRRRMSLSMLPQRIRDHANRLHKVLTAGWRCDCRLSHNANLLLENRISPASSSKSEYTDESDIHFNVLFQYAPFPANSTLPWTLQETQITVLEGISRQPSPEPSIQSFKSAAATLVELGSSGKTNAKKNVRKVGFAQDIPLQLAPSVVFDENQTEINDLCSTLKDARERRDSLGFLVDEERRRYSFSSVEGQQMTSDTHDTISLETILRKGMGDSSDEEKIRLSRRDRLLVAVMLTSSLLQLYSTPWLHEKWSKKNIFFVKSHERSPHSFVVNQLYISSSNPSENLSNLADQITAAANDCRQVLRSLGIMLLELCFGQALEDQHFRKKYLGPDGQPNDFTDMATAMKWQDDVLGEGGQEFDNAIRRCLNCAFGPKSTDLADNEFREAVYSEVVQPLEESLKRFDKLVS